jgi:hypothetical protein
LRASRRCTLFTLTCLGFGGLGQHALALCQPSPEVFLHRISAAYLGVVLGGLLMKLVLALVGGIARRVQLPLCPRQRALRKAERGPQPVSVSLCTGGAAHLSAAQEESQTT